jgi:hypothetical protein
MADSLDFGEWNNTEKCYRRGFAHGARAVFEAMDEGASLTTIREWLYGEIKSWRHGPLFLDGNPDAVVEPPKVPSKK